MSWSALSNQFIFLLHSFFVEAEPHSFQSCCWKRVVQPFCLCISVETSECSVKSGNTCAFYLLSCADSCSRFFVRFVNSQKLLRSPRKPTRKISKIPFKVLDAPELQDDFYLNLVDWSSLNVLSVGLGTCVYLWSACTSQVNGHKCLEIELPTDIGFFQNHPPELCDVLCDGFSTCHTLSQTQH